MALLEKYPAFNALLIALVLFAIYAPGLHGALIGADTLAVIAFAEARGPLAPCSEAAARWQHLYRPAYVFAAWVQAKAFGLEIFGAYFITVLLFTVSAVLFWRLLRQTGAEALPALLLACALYAQPHTAAWTRWVLDPMLLTVIVLELVLLLLLARRAPKPLPLTALMVAALLLRESGLVVVAAVGAYALVSRRQTARLLAGAAFAVGAYFALRLHTVPLDALLAAAQVSAVSPVHIAFTYLRKTFLPAAARSWAALDLIYTALSLLAFYALLRLRRWPRRHQLAAALALGVIGANSAVHAPYFAERLLYMGLLGWLLLLGVGVQHMQGRARAAAHVLLAAAVLLGGGSVRQSLPQFRPGEFDQTLCQLYVPDDIAIRAASYYHIDTDSVRLCRDARRAQEGSQ